MHAIYDDIGNNYSVTRCTDPKIAKQLYSELQGATRIVNIGAGTGSYEPEDIELVAVDPSSVMISQMSPFSKIKNLSEGLQKLEDDLASGVWARNNHAILGSSYLDVGYRLVSARVRNA